MQSQPLPTGSLFLDRFQVTGVAASGGMGTVYRAYDLQTGTHVALKVVHPLAQHGGLDARFQSESQVLSELRHPAIVAYVTHGIAPTGDRFLVMEWLEGEDLGQRLLRGPLSLPDCLTCMMRVADALAFAHQRGIVHRDLKPANLFLCAGDVAQVKLLDFGIARRFSSLASRRPPAPDGGRSQALTQTGFVVGTPEYMAPEQVRGTRDPTPASDLFSLGCVLYECLAGQPPFAASDYTAVLTRILFAEPDSLARRRPGLPADLVALVESLLRKEPAERPSDASAVRQALQAVEVGSDAGLATTLVMPAPQSSPFASEEQGLFSIVVARVVAGSVDPSDGKDRSPSVETPWSTQESRRSLFDALGQIGVRPDALSDGSLIVTVPASGSAQDQARRAARAALLIKEQWPAAWVSMATGRGSIQRGATVGDVVDLATHPMHEHDTLAREVREAAAHSVFLDPLSAQLLGEGFAIHTRVGQPLLRSEARDVDTSRPLLGKPTPCVGREVELAYLETRLSVCREEAQAHAVLVTAPPGMGKSRLRHELLRRMDKQDEPWVRLVARAELGGSWAPYELLGSALRRLAGIDPSTPVDAQRERLRDFVIRHLAPSARERVCLFLCELCQLPYPQAGRSMLQAARQQPMIMRDRVRRAFLDWLAAECRRGPVLVVLDDLQWSDELTVALLHEALQEQKDAPLCVLAFARPEVHKTFPKLWAGTQLQELALKELSRRACERLLRQVLGNQIPLQGIAETVELSQGNALFLEELIRAHAEGTSDGQPQTVLAMLQSRLTRLEAAPRRTVLAAAVFGQTFARAGVAALLQLPPTAQLLSSSLQTLQEAELIQRSSGSSKNDDDGFMFRHALVRDAAYALLSGSDRTTGHRLAAEFLEQSHAADAAVIAEHFENSGEQERAATQYWLAAERCFQQGDYRGALRQVERGSRCSQDRELLARLSSVECAIAYRTGRFSERHAARAIEALTVLKPGSIAWSRATAGAITTLMILRDRQQATRLFGQLISTDPEPDGRAAYIDSLSYLTSWSALGAPLPLVEALLSRLQSVVQAALPDLPSARYYLDGSLAQVALYRRGSPYTAWQTGEQSARLAHENADTMAEFHMRCHIVELSRLELGDHTGVIERMTALQPQVFATQEAGLSTLHRQVLSRALCESSREADWQQAIALTEPFLKVRNLMFFAQAIQARVALLRGDLQTAHALISEAVPSVTMLPFYLLDVVVTQIRCLCALGLPVEGVAAADAALTALRQPASLGPYEVAFHLATSEALRDAGQTDRAQQVLAQALRQLQHRLADIVDPALRRTYLTGNAHCRRVLQQAAREGLELPPELIIDTLISD